MYNSKVLEKTERGLIQFPVMNRVNVYGGLITECIFEATEDIGTLDMSFKKIAWYLGKPDYNFKIDT